MMHFYFLATRKVIILNRIPFEKNGIFDETWSRTALPLHWISRFGQGVVEHVN